MPDICYICGLARRTKESYVSVEIQGAKQLFGLWIHTARVTVSPTMNQTSNLAFDPSPTGGPSSTTWMNPKKPLRKSPSKSLVPQPDINQEKDSGSRFSLLMIVRSEEKSSANQIDIMLAFGSGIFITNLVGPKGKRKRFPLKSNISDI